MPPRRGHVTVWRVDILEPGLSALTSLLAAGMVIVSLLVAAWLFSAQLERTQHRYRDSASPPSRNASRGCLRCAPP